MKTITTFCRFCDHECPVEVFLDEEGAPEKLCPLWAKEGFWCPTGVNVPALLRHPARLCQPLKRVGAKGAGQWQPISWQQAFDTMAAHFNRVLREEGPESLLSVNGFNKPFSALMQGRFANVLGLVNRAAAGNMCHFARSQSAVDTFGYPIKNQVWPSTKTVFLWGYHPKATLRWDDAALRAAVKNGAKLVLIDPRAGSYGPLASLWLPIRPGADLALGLGMLHIIFKNGWQDEALLARHAKGLNTLREQVAPYTPAYTAAQTGLEAAQIEEAARLLAKEKPGIIWAGNALDHNADGYQKGRVIAALMAVTGNIDVEGGALKAPPPNEKNGFATRVLALGGRFTPEMKQRRLGGGEGVHPDFAGVSGQAVVEDLLQGGKLKAAYVAGGDPAVMWASPEATGEALKKLEFMAVADYFLTPTAQLADLVLPVASYLETESVAVDGDGNLFYSPRLAGPPEVKSDMEILNTLANVMGYQQEFWPGMDAFWDEFLAPYGITFAQLREKGQLLCGTKAPAPKVQNFYEKGFPTEDGKLHLALPLAGFGPLQEALPKPEIPERWPHICTCYKPDAFFHSAGRQMPAQRHMQPRPVAFLGQALAKELHLKDGDWVRVSTPEGWAEQTVKLEQGMAKDVVALASGWWYPEENGGPRALRADVNRLAPRKEGQGKTIPSFSCRGLACKIEKIPPQNLMGKEERI